jgi:hypothetical protein
MSCFFLKTCRSKVWCSCGQGNASVVPFQFFDTVTVRVGPKLPVVELNETSLSYIPFSLKRRAVTRVHGKTEIMALFLSTGLDFNRELRRVVSSLRKYISVQQILQLQVYVISFFNEQKEKSAFLLLRSRSELCHIHPITL